MEYTFDLVNPPKDLPERYKEVWHLIVLGRPALDNLLAEALGYLDLGVEIELLVLPRINQLLTAIEANHKAWKMLVENPYLSEDLIKTLKKLGEKDAKDLAPNPVAKDDWKPI